MLGIIKRTLLAAALLTLAACGGSGGSSGSTGVTVAPSGVQVLAGANQQMSATAGDGSTAFTWQVNGVTGGTSNTGTISGTGLYTAPTLPPVGGQVTITAVEQSNAMLSGTATLNIGYSNVSLNGAYVFIMGGLKSGISFQAIGEFTANGAGQLSSGLQDINNGTTALVKQPFSGNYSITPSGLGTISLGGVSTQFVMLLNGSAIFISTDNTTIASGSFGAQDQNVGAISNLSGPFVFSLSGANTLKQNIVMLGQVTADTNGTLPSGTEDVNGPNPLINAPVTGVYSFDGNNHGTLSLTDGNGTHQYSFYLQSAGGLDIQSSDPSQPMNGGFSAQSPGSFTNASLSGGYVFALSGNSPSAAYAQAGQFNPNGQGSLGSITEDINTAGNVGMLTPTGTYTFDPSGNGRGTITINGQGQNTPQTYVFYLSSQAEAQWITINSNIVADGLMLSQQQGTSFGNSSLNGNFGLGIANLVNPTSLNEGLGTLALDGKGNVSGSLIQNLNGSVPPVLTISGSYLLNGGVRGTLTLTSNGGGNLPFAIYPVAAGGFVVIGTSANAYSGIAFIRY